MTYTESDTRAKLIDPALKAADWTEDCIKREYAITDGRKLAGGARGERLILDYLLRFKNQNLAIIEAKRADKEPTAGLQQAIGYADKLSIRFVYATNGEKIYEFDRHAWTGTFVDRFPTPEELFHKTFAEKEGWKTKFANVPFRLEDGMIPRYYQEVAINRTLEAVADERKRVLLTLATGTGKTFVAFQIVWKMFQARWNLDGTERRPRILFLADRNILADQAINTFNPLERDLVKITGKEIQRRGGKVPTNAHVFFAIYQAIADNESSAEDDEAMGGFFREYPADFFDAVIIDECHRGWATQDGNWREVLEYFSSAVQIGLTATPKRKDNVDTYGYFGDPVYQYSLKDGIGDWFLTPYKVKRFRTSLDEIVLDGNDKIIHWTPEKDLYGMADFERVIVVNERTELIAKSILENIGPMDKTIVFCVDQDHALRMRDAINKYKSVKDENYCVRVTSDEGILGRQMLERFQDNDKDIPVILTSSQMLTTGVDARNVRNIVLVRNIGSMVEFKQIVGRGTRVFDGKDYFTILDFTGATNLFYDKEWDGEPDEPEPMVSKPSKPPKFFGDTGETISDPLPKKERIEVELGSGRKVKILDVETRYPDPVTGKPLTAREFLERLVGQLPEFAPSEAELRKIWSKPESREEFLLKLAQKGYDAEQLETLQDLLEAQSSDIFDVLAYLAWGKEIIDRSDRVELAKGDAALFANAQSPLVRDFLLFVLDRYRQDGIAELSRWRLGGLVKIKFGTPADAEKAFGSLDELMKKFYRVQEDLFAVR